MDAGSLWGHWSVLWSQLTVFRAEIPKITFEILFIGIRLFSQWIPPYSFQMLSWCGGRFSNFLDFEKKSSAMRYRTDFKIAWIIDHFHEWMRYWAAGVTGHSGNGALDGRFWPLYSCSIPSLELSNHLNKWACTVNNVNVMHIAGWKIRPK